MPVITMGTNNWEEEMDAMKAMSLRRTRKRRHALGFRKKSSPGIPKS